MTNELKDFIGIPATVEAVRGARRSEENARAFIVLSLPITDQNRELIAEVMIQIKNKIFVGFGFMQGALPWDDEPNAPVVEQPELERVRMTVNGEDADVVRPARTGLVPHPFRATLDHANCFYCRREEGDTIHDTPDDLLERPDPEADAGDAPSPEAQALIDEARRAAETPEEAADQAEAAAALASRSRSR